MARLVTGFHNLEDNMTRSFNDCDERTSLTTASSDAATLRSAIPKDDANNAQHEDPLSGCRCGSALC